MGITTEPTSPELRQTCLSCQSEHTVALLRHSHGRKRLDSLDSILQVNLNITSVNETCRKVLIWRTDGSKEESGGVSLICLVGK